MQKTDSDQLIVIDGESTDGTIDLLKQYSKDIDILVVEADNGQADALHKGFAMAAGDILAYLNSDDMLLPGTFSFVKKYFEKHEHVDAIYSNRVFIDPSGNPVNNWVIPFHSNYCHRRWDYIPQETCFWRKTLMEDAGSIDPDLQFAMDYDLFVRMMNAGTFKHTHRYLACFRDHPDSKTNTLYETVGNQEILAIKSRYGIHTHWYDRIIGNIYGQLVLQLGRLAFTISRLTGHKRLSRRIAVASK